MGFGFVEYKKPEQAQKALKQLQVSWGFWAITVRPWPKKDEDPTPLPLPLVTLTRPFFYHGSKHARSSWQALYRTL